MNANPPKKLPAAVTGEPQDLELVHQIRLRAYELYEARGREDGHDIEDWHRGLAPSRNRTHRKEGPRHRCLMIAAYKVSAPTPRGFFHASRRIYQQGNSPRSSSAEYHLDSWRGRHTLTTSWSGCINRSLPTGWLTGRSDRTLRRQSAKGSYRMADHPPEILASHNPSLRTIIARGWFLHLARN
jgi:DUF2934 family protein